MNARDELEDLNLEEEELRLRAQAQGNQSPTLGAAAKQMASDYGPYVGTGLGEDAAIGYAGALSPGMMAAQLLTGGRNYYSSGLPGTIQKGIEQGTGPWPQPQTGPQYAAKYLGNALPFVPPALYGLGRLGAYGMIGAGVAGAASDEWGKALYGYAKPYLPNF